MERIKLSEKLEVSRIVYGMWRLVDDHNTSASHVENKINKYLIIISHCKIWQSGVYRAITKFIY